MALSFCQTCAVTMTLRSLAFTTSTIKLKNFIYYTIVIVFAWQTAVLIVSQEQLSNLKNSRNLHLNRIHLVVTRDYV